MGCRTLFSFKYSNEDFTIKEYPLYNFTYPSLLKACSHLLSLKEGMQIHGNVVKFGFDTNIFVQNSLISFYGKCGETKLCCKVFELMDQKSVASWSALISSHAKVGLWSDCLKIFGDMCRDGKFRADESILVGLANHGRAEEAITVFSDMLEEGIEPDDITYVGVLRACSSVGLVIF
ncbi:hypothetical protein GIB67_031603 [Kingdonia uniflora]|uniref:Pentatricopeptide repeat-containing protein n=1 Tax=Kingdonia uniflora TaxID=39325 RepID=A0A7J7LYE8_9MAGN|nr:hypothetical protein GIB67_031603 [Kingdonia uniflora]